VKLPLPRHLTPSRLALALALLCGGLLLALLALRAIGERTLRGGAEQIATGYVKFMRDSAPGLDRLFETGRLDADTRDRLAGLRRLGEVYRFKVFDAQGQPLLASDHLDAADPPAASRQHWPGRDANGRPYPAPAEALAGRAVLEVRHGGGEVDRPATYIEAYVPSLKDGRVIGVVEVYLDHTARFARMRSALWQIGAVLTALLMLVGGLTLAGLAQARAASRRSEERAHWLAEHDPLTGAINRTCFVQALAERLADPAAAPRCAVLSIDLDRFRLVNEAHGHAAGDAILREVATRLRELLRPGELMARLSADEFALLLADAADVETLARLAQRVVEALAEPYVVGKTPLEASASVGVVGIDAAGVGAAELLHRADVAVARAKQAGGGRFSFYDPSLDRDLEERRLLAQALREAAAAGVLEMHYQPLYAADGVTLLGYEALMRWPHPTRGMVPPAVFIPLAEATGQIGALGALALERACTEAARWPGALSVAVNLSAAQFGDGDALVALVQRCLAHSGLPPERLVLEITESLLMSDVESVVRTLNALAMMHVQIAMDDFGTGYSSLGSLWRFPFGKVKIDRAFVKDLEHDDRVALVVRSIVSLAHSLAMRVTAEGVETPRQAAMLRRLGCDELQGFLFGRPAPAGALSHAGAADTRPERPAAPHWDDLATRPAAL
jgi:diguanylate cyclase (GGDEF)-like protein